MNCPVCHVPLRITDRQGIEIDHCPQCRGVWLDRGELDKIIERSVAPGFRAAYDDDDDDDEYEGRRYGDHEARRYGDHDARRYGDHDDHRRRRRKSFLEDLFDFG